MYSYFRTSWYFYDFIPFMLLRFVYSRTWSVLTCSICLKKNLYLVWGITCSINVNYISLCGNVLVSNIFSDFLSLVLFIGYWEVEVDISNFTIDLSIFLSVLSGSALRMPKLCCGDFSFSISFFIL